MLADESHGSKSVLLEELSHKHFSSEQFHNLVQIKIHLNFTETLQKKTNIQLLRFLTFASFNWTVMKRHLSCKTKRGNLNVEKQMIFAYSGSWKALQVDLRLCLGNEDSEQ